MKYSIIYTAAMASLVSYVAADFQIYYETQVTDQPGEDDPGTSTGIIIVDGQPSCDDVNDAKFIELVGDASDATYARCEGCDDEADIKSWDIEELEINADGWNHITLYKDGDYILTQSDGSDSLGDCDRVDEDDAREYNCAIPFRSGKGTRIFNCHSEELGAHKG